MQKWKKFFISTFVVFALGIALLTGRGSPKKQASCPFCSVKNLEELGIYQGDLASVVLTHKPSFDGHLLIVPNRHVERFEELTDQEILEMGQLIRKTEAAVRSLLGTKEYLIHQKNGRGVGQSVPHVHVHITPKPEGMSQWRYYVQMALRPLQKPVDKETAQKTVGELRAYFSEQLLGDRAAEPVAQS